MKTYTVNTITLDQVDVYELHKFTSAASDLGWPVGHVPKFIPTTMGNGCDFYLKKATSEMFVYLQTGGCIELTVFND